MFCREIEQLLGSLTPSRIAQLAEHPDCAWQQGKNRRGLDYDYQKNNEFNSSITVSIASGLYNVQLSLATFHEKRFEKL